jgi:hypothetical protein
MPDTIREQIIQAFAIKTGAARCLKLDSDSDLPAKSIWDNQEEATKTAYQTVQASLPLPIEYLALVDKTTYSSHSAQCNAMLGELIQSATDGDNTLLGLCRSINYAESEFIYPEDGGKEIEVYAVFNIVYHFLLGDPFTLG